MDALGRIRCRKWPILICLDSASPATSIPAFAKGYDVPPGSGQTLWTEWAGFSFPINLGQQPACVVPCDLTDDGRPIGVQVIGPRGADDSVLEFALASEAIIGQI
ncbi:MAG: amidase family protein [Roseiarcus sp.]|jgi:amidase/aspartyl-tRNA(Asn)/glutamyl-tRNA(Gln) amidotransferase subunit A